MRRLACTLPLALLLAAPPALADVADDTAFGGDEGGGEEGGEAGTGDDGEDEDEDADDDKGCAHAALNPVTGVSLLVGAGLLLGLRRRPGT